MYDARMLAYSGHIPPSTTTIQINESYEGETIEQRVEKIQNNKEPIGDGAPQIYTERAEGVIPEYNVRSDRWDMALDMADQITKNSLQKRQEAFDKRNKKDEPTKQTTDPKTDASQGSKPVDPTKP